MFSKNTVILWKTKFEIHNNFLVERKVKLNLLTNEMHSKLSYHLIALK